MRLSFFLLSFVLAGNVCLAQGIAVQPFLPKETPSADSPQQRERESGRRPRLVFRDRVAAHWFAENSRFWYRNDLPGGAKEFVLVDTESGARRPAFDHAGLAAALSAAAAAGYVADRLPFDAIAFPGDGESIAFLLDSATWIYDPASDRCARTDEEIAFPDEDRREENFRGRRRQGRGGSRSTRANSEASPDGQWTAYLKDHNVHLRAESGAEDVALSSDGTEDQPYGLSDWGPDSNTLTAFRIQPGERKEVYLLQSAPPGGGRAQFQSRPYALPGDKFPTYQLHLFHVAEKRSLKLEVDPFEHEWLRPQLHWNSDSRRFTWLQTDRGHQRLRVIEADARTGETRCLIDEHSDTFIWTAHTENLNLQIVTWLSETNEILYVSERSGWRHLYRLDPDGEAELQQVTSGEWVLRGIERVDEEARQIWFSASGVYPGQDPYLIHHGRVDFDGGNLTWLTSGNGNHTITWSPGRKHLIATWSRVDLAPVTELRRASDGALLCRLEEADTSGLESTGWKAPEVFVAKGRDGTTDIWGIVCLPPGFDPAASYPVIEDIYAGPQSSFVPKSFSAQTRYESLTGLGFIVVKIDGMGTANRSKAFHDVCWHNLKDGGFEDRILWMQAAAVKFPQMDLSRVGIYGNSAGGQNAAAAVLFHPDFYKAAVASCGCHDNRMDKASWNEQWMGYPVGPQYSESSNIDNAHRLRGNLFLIVGEMDNNVPPESTMRFAEALIRAGKDFDLLVIPNGGHGMGGGYGQRRMQDFFVRRLLGREPPDRNAPAGETATSATDGES
ncbi:MAG TPA: prolyl oligopeptidase family serine peptidase [Verrucomicrobiales bacterium]|nr:prolyl oligopeptidase family serine peptidase [Verrucomicrobiales bacterium]